MLLTRFILAGAATHLIEVEEQWFEGAPRFSSDGTEYMPGEGHEDSGYTGEPSKAIDDNWELLHWGEIFICTKCTIE